MSDCNGNIGSGGWEKKMIRSENTERMNNSSELEMMVDRRKVPASPRALANGFSNR
jgi:hypothetical protein